MPRRRRAVTRVAAAATIILVSAACSNGLGDLDKQTGRTGGAPQQDSATTSVPSHRGSESLNGWTPKPLTWRACKDHRGYQCSTLRVPLDWSHPEGTMIDLALGRHRATGRRIGALVTNPGGPGGSGLDLLFADPLLPKLTSRFDIVSWDPRGVGASTAFKCDSKVTGFLHDDPDPDDQAEQDRIDADAKAVADECAAKDAGLAGHVGTDDVARDLEAIRIALGEPKLTYLGFSYGTLIGLRYLAQFPTHARAIVLDGVVDPTQGFAEWLTGQTTAIDASIKRAFAACDKRADCPLDNSQASYDQLKAKVEAQPEPAGPGKVLGPAELETGTVFVSYEPSLWPDLADAISSGLHGDGAPMLQLAQDYYDFGGFTAYAAVECLDSPHPEGAIPYREFADKLRKLSPRFGGSVANELLPCAYWATPPHSIVGPVTGAGGPPVLVLGNRGDAATPYAGSIRVAKMLTRGHLVSNDGEGHTSYGRSSCVDNVVHAYLIDLRVPAKDPDCK